MSEPVFLTRAELGMAPPKSISRNVVPSRGGVMAHWGGGRQNVTTLDAAVAKWLAWQRMHMAPGGLGAANGGADIGYNVGFWRQYVFAGRGRQVRSGANGTNDANGRFLAVVWIGGDGDPVTDDDVATFLWLVGSLRETGAGPEVKPHSLVRPTACPGDRWRAEAVLLDGRPIPTAPPAPDPDPDPQPDPRPDPPAPTWTETLVTNLPQRSRRSDLSRANAWDRRIQGLLAAAGVLPIGPNTRNGRFDGRFGPSTEQAVRRFQQSAGIGVDGIVGPITWTKLLGR